jgi:pimeloyl-ACP methyl ester carboxylesterase
MGRRTIALAGAGAAGLRAELPDAVRELLDLEYVVPHGRTVAAVGAEVAAALGGEPALLFGHSMNGTLALAAATLVPAALVVGTIAVGAPPSLPLDVDAIRAHWLAHAEPERRRRFDECSQRAANATDDDERQRWIDAADSLRRWHDLDADETESAARYDRPQAETLAWVAAIFGDAAGAGVDWRHVREHQPAPVLLALGRSDFLVPHTAWDDENTPATCTTVRFGRSGHTPFAEEPERFTDELRAWLAELA